MLCCENRKRGQTPHAPFHFHKDAHRARNVPAAAAGGRRGRGRTVSRRPGRAAAHPGGRRRRPGGRQVCTWQRAAQQVVIKGGFNKKSGAHRYATSVPFVSNSPRWRLQYSSSFLLICGGAGRRQRGRLRRVAQRGAPTVTARGTASQATPSRHRAHRPEQVGLLGGLGQVQQQVEVVLHDLCGTAGHRQDTHFPIETMGLSMDSRGSRQRSALVR